MNKHISEACVDYITNKKNPEYGLFINGPWGCGKTFFINKLIEHIITSEVSSESLINKNDVAMISLYGINNVADIAGKIFLETHKKLDTKLVDRLSKGVDVATKLILNVDTSTTMQMIFREWFESKTRKVIVVDDLERSDIPINEIFGYFFEAIIKYNARVIFIGNESEVMLKCEDFKRIKEKVIGETFTLVAEADNAIKSFLKEIEFKGINTELLKNEVLNVIGTLEIDNMRNVRQAFIHALRLVEAVKNSNAYINCDQGNQDYTKENYIIEIIKTYMILYLQKACDEFKVEKTNSKEQRGINESDAISMTIGVYQNKGWSQKKYLDVVKPNEEGAKKSYQHLAIKRPTGFVALYMRTENGYSLWGDYLIRSQIDYGTLDEAIRVDSKQFSSYEEEGISLVKLIRESYDMSNSDFRQTYDKFMYELNNGVYKMPGELLHAFSLCLRLHEYGVIVYKQGELLAYFDEIIQNVAMEEEFTKNETFDLRFGSLGYEFSDNLNKGDGEIFYKRLKLKVHEQHQLALKLTFLEMFNELNSNEGYDAWVRLLHPFASGESSEYYKQPIISWLNAEDIVELLKSKSYSQQREFINIMKKRYEQSSYDKSIMSIHLKDVSVLKEMRVLYGNYIDSINKGDIALMSAKHVMEMIDELWVDINKLINAESPSSK